MAYLKQKPGSIEDVVAEQQTQYQDPAYQKLYDEELKNTMGGIGSMTPKEKQSFHSKIDSQYKKEEVNHLEEGKFEVTADVRFKNQRQDTIQDVVVVVNAKNKEDAEEEAIDFINNERMKGRWPKPYTGGNFSIDEFYPTDITPTTRKLGVVSMGEETIVENSKKDRDIPAVSKYSKKGGFHYWDRPVKYNRIKKFYYHPKGAKPYPPGPYTKKEGLETMIPNKKDDVKDLKRKVTMTGEKPTKVDMEPEVKMDTQKPYSGKTNK